MLCVEGQISSYELNMKPPSNCMASSAVTYQFFAGEDLIVYEIYIHRGTRDGLTSMATR